MKLEDKYDILRILGEGGNAAVLLVRDRKLQILRAAKVILKRRGNVPDRNVQSALREINFLKILSHPYIPRIVEIFETSDAWYLVMDYVDGKTLRTLLQRDGRIPRREAYRILIQLCQVLMYLHQRSRPIVYGDLKPENVIRRTDGMISLIDFGTAEQIHRFGYRTNRNVQGSYGYAAPEILSDEGQVDVRADIYSLGILALELLTGYGTDVKLRRRMRRLCLLHGIAIYRVIKKCIRKNPGYRYASMAEVCKKLRKIARK